MEFESGTTALDANIPSINEFKLIDGDMLIEADQISSQDLNLIENMKNFNDESVAQKAGRNLVQVSASYWNQGLMPLKFQSTFTQAQKNIVYADCAKWAKVANIKCVNYNPSIHLGTNYIDVTNTEEGCSATFGRPNTKPGRLSLAAVMPVTYSLPEGTCLSPGIVMHEFGHLLGMAHEQSRHDRDQFVTFNYANLKPDCTSLTYKYQSSQLVNVGPYDYYSIMHYSQFHCSSNGGATMLPKLPLEPNYILGDAVLKDFELSIQDISYAKEIYGPPTSNASGTFSPIIGSIGQVTLNSGKLDISGWACHIGLPDSLRVHIYSGGEINKGGVLIGNILSSFNHDAAIEKRCMGNGKAYKFVTSINLSSYTNIKANKAIYAYGISKVSGISNSLLSNSGQFFIPANYEKVIGSLGAIQIVDTRLRIYGWTCHVGKPDSLNVHIYINNTAGNGGTMIKNVLSTIAHEPQVESNCKGGGKTYRYETFINRNDTRLKKGAKIYAYGISKVSGQPNGILANSGNRIVP